MADLPASTTLHPDVVLVTLARELAIDHYPLETILEQHRITTETWLTIKSNPRFIRLLESEIVQWQGALNTEQRVKLKAASVVEEFLPEAHQRLHTSSEILSSKVELFKAVARIAGMGMTGVGVEGAGGDRFSVTINLGADSQLKFEGKSPKTIDAVASE